MHPTARIVDSQRVDRIRKIVRLTAGEFVDILENRGAPIPLFRVTLKHILTDGDAPAARIFVEYGGTALSCGPLVQELVHNDFVLPSNRLATIRARRFSISASAAMRFDGVDQR